MSDLEKNPYDWAWKQTPDSKPTPEKLSNSFKISPSTSVKDFHNNDDVDSGQMAHHHTLGYGVNQAAPGYSLKEALATIEAMQAEIDAVEAVNVSQQSEIDALQTENTNQQAEIDALQDQPNAYYTSTGGAIATGGAPGVVHTTNWSAAEAIVGITYSGNGRWTIIKPGRYRISGRCSFVVSTAGQRVISIFKNGVALLTQIQSAAGTANSSGPRIAETLRLVAGDYIELGVAQNATTSPTTLSCNGIGFQLEYVGP